MRVMCKQTAALALGIFTLSAGISGCFMRPKMMTPADFDAFGVRSYQGVSKESAIEASTSALKTLGFEVTVADRASGMVKTAPRYLMTSSSATASGTHAVSTSHGHELAWTIEIEGDAGSSKVRATPRAFMDGQQLPGDQIPIQAIKPKYDDLWRELSEAMRVARSAAPPT